MRILSLHALPLLFDTCHCLRHSDLHDAFAVLFRAVPLPCTASPIYAAAILSIAQLIHATPHHCISMRLFSLAFTRMSHPGFSLAYISLLFHI
jgi:hypothetical protein